MGRGDIPFNHREVIEQAAADFHNLIPRTPSFRSEKNEKNTRNDLQNIEKAIKKFLKQELSNVNWDDREAVGLFCKKLTEEIESHKTRFIKALSRITNLDETPAHVWETFVHQLSDLRNKTKQEIIARIEQIEAELAEAAAQTQAIKDARLAAEEALQQAVATKNQAPSDLETLTDEELEALTRPDEEPVSEESQAKNSTEEESLPEPAKEIPPTRDQQLLDTLIAADNKAVLIDALQVILQDDSLEDPEKTRAEALNLFYDLAREVDPVDSRVINIAERAAHGPYRDMEVVEVPADEEEVYELLEEAEEAQRELEQALNDKEKDLQVKKTEIAVLRTRIATLEFALRSRQQNFVRDDTTIHRLRERINTLEAYAASLEKNLSKKATHSDDEMVAGLRAAKERLQSQLEEKQMVLDNLTREMSSTITALEQKLEAAKTSEASRKSLKESLTTGIASIEEVLQNLDDAVYDIVDWISEIRPQIDRFITEQNLTRELDTTAVERFKQYAKKEVDNYIRIKDALESKQRQFRDTLDAYNQYLAALVLLEDDPPTTPEKPIALLRQVDDLPFPDFDEMRERFTTHTPAVETPNASIESAIPFLPETLAALETLPYDIYITPEMVAAAQAYEQTIQAFQGVATGEISEQVEMRLPADKYGDYYNELLGELEQGSYLDKVKLAFTILGAMRDQERHYKGRMARDIGLMMKLKGVKIVEELGEETKAVTRSLLKTEILTAGTDKLPLVGRKHVGSSFGRAYELTLPGQQIAEVWTAELLQNGTITATQLTTIANWMKQRDLKQKSK